MRIWFAIATCLLFLCVSTPALASKLVVLEAGPLPGNLHPFQLTSTRQGLRLSGLMVQRLGLLDPEENTLTLPLFKEVKRTSATTFEASLRSSVRFSDGRRVSARDISASFSRLLTAASQTGAPQSVMVLARSLFMLERVDVLDDYLARLVFRQPVQGAELPGLLALLPVIPGEISSDVLVNPGAPTCAPYWVSSWDKGVINLKANAYYYAGKPKIDEIEIRTVTAEEMEGLMGREGNSQLAMDVPPNILPTLRKQPDVVLRPANTHRILYIGFNRQPGSRLAETPALRPVVSALIDRAALLEALPLGGESVALLTGPFSQESGFADPKIESPAFSVPFAAQALADLGFRRIGERYRDPAGRQLRMRVVVCSWVYGADLVARLVKEMLEREGMEVEISTIDFEQFVTLLQKPRGDYDLIIHEWLLDSGEDVYEVYHSKGIYNYLGYANSTVDDRLVLVRRASQIESKALYLQEIHRSLSRDMPALFLWSSHDVVALRGDVLGVPPLDPFFVFRKVHQWRVGESEDGGEEASAGEKGDRKGEDAKKDGTEAKKTDAQLLEKDKPAADGKDAAAGGKEGAKAAEGSSAAGAEEKKAAPSDDKKAEKDKGKASSKEEKKAAKEQEKAAKEQEKAAKEKASSQEAKKEEAAKDEKKEEAAKGEEKK